MKNVFIVVDMQNDFLSMCLGYKGYEKTVRNVVSVLKNKVMEDDVILVTKDTHDKEEYPSTLEGKSIPLHCVKGTSGWEIEKSIQKELDSLSSNHEVIEFEKPTFGSSELFGYLLDHQKDFDNVYILGVCTSICVHAQAVLARTALKDTPVFVLKDAVGDGNQPMADAALASLAALQITVLDTL